MFSGFVTEEVGLPVPSDEQLQVINAKRVAQGRSKVDRHVCLKQVSGQNSQRVFTGVNAKFCSNKFEVLDSKIAFFLHGFKSSLNCYFFCYCCRWQDLKLITILNTTGGLRNRRLVERREDGGADCSSHRCTGAHVSLFSASLHV